MKKHKRKHIKLTPEIKEQIVNACKTAFSIRAAALSIGMMESTFRRYAKSIGAPLRPNRGGKGRPKKGRPTVRKYALDYILSGQPTTIKSDTLKKRLILDGIRPHQCEKCKIEEWNGFPVPIELHHIDGNSKNHHKDNIQILCSNCHSQTDNFCGKNKRK